jgi:hypothetical protein
MSDPVAQRVSFARPRYQTLGLPIRACVVLLFPTALGFGRLESAATDCGERSGRCCLHAGVG